MPNAARDLFDLLKSWGPVLAGSTSERQRGSGSADRVDFWHQQSLAVALLLEVEEHLAGMAAHGDDVEHYFEVLPAWYRAVFSYNVPWTSTEQHARPIIAPADLLLLRALAGAIDSLQMVPPLLADQRASILAALDEAESKIRQAADLSDQVRRYLLGLVVEARRVTLDHETFGTEAVRSATLELGGALYTLAEQIQDPQRSEGWQATAKAITVQFLGGTFAQAAIEGAKFISG